MTIYIRTNDAAHPIVETMDDFICSICNSWDDSLTPDNMVCEYCTKEGL